MGFYNTIRVMYKRVPLRGFFRLHRGFIGAAAWCLGSVQGIPDFMFKDRVRDSSQSKFRFGYGFRVNLSDLVAEAEFSGCQRHWCP